ASSMPSDALAPSLCSSFFNSTVTAGPANLTGASGRIWCDMYPFCPYNCSMASETEATSTIRNPSIRGSPDGCAISQSAAANAAAAAIHKVRFIRSPYLFPVVRTAWNRARENIRVHHHDQPDQHHKRDAVLQHRAEQVAFLTYLLGNSASDHQRLSRDHLPHHAAGALGRAHQNRA